MSEENTIPPEAKEPDDGASEDSRTDANTPEMAAGGDAPGVAAAGAAEAGVEEELLLSQEEINAVLGAPADSEPDIRLTPKETVASEASGGAMMNEEEASGTSAEGAGGWEGKAEPPAMPEFEMGGGPGKSSGIELLDDVELNVKIELGRAEMYVEDVLRLGVGSVVELNKLAGDPVDIFVNDRLIGRGEVLVLNDNFCVRINEILSPVPEAEK